MSNEYERKVELEEAIAAVREDAAPAGVAESAAARAWANVAREAGLAAAGAATIGGCADVHALFAARRAGTLPPARALLFDDHLRECAACRAAYREPGRPALSVLPWRPAAPEVSAARPRRPGPALAAAAALVAALAGALAWQARVAAPAGPRAVVQSVTGLLQQVGAGAAPSLAPGAELLDGQAVRTAGGARAHLRLRDGSLLEMGERAELSVAARGDETVVRLERGSIIVQAAQRRSGRLRVASVDCDVYVTGTVFSVSGGLKGSRVSVLEGRVRVVRAGEEKLLAPGEQWATSAAMGAVPVSEEIAWSRDLDSHLALLGEIQALGEKWKAVRLPGLRYESRLLGVLPAATVLYASLPNYGEALADAHRLFQERLLESPALANWWREADPARRGGPSLAAAIEEVRKFAETLGDEVVLAAVHDGRAARLLLLAELRQPGLPELIEAELREVAARGGKPPRVRFLGEAGGGPSVADPELFVLVRGGLVAVALDTWALQQLSLAGEAGGLAGTPLGERLLAAYGEGVGLLVGADLERLTAGHEAKLAPTGIDALRQVVVAERELQGRRRVEAGVSFAGPRRGIASWLAEPGPMGTLDFVTPNALVAAAVLAKSPARILDDVLAIARGEDARADGELERLQSQLDLRLREDIFETLGSELALALDGPLLPTPSWKLVAEVYDPARLQASLQVLVGKANEEDGGGRPGLRLEAEQVDGRVCHSLRGGELPFEIHYAFADGYLVAAPSRALVLQALRARESGDSLGRAPSFRALFPADRLDHVSGLVYQDLGSALGGLAGAAAPALSEQQRRSLDALSRGSRPTLLLGYGEREGIKVVADSAGFLGVDPADLALPLLLERGLAGTLRRAVP